MGNASTVHEPSMEEILASIRQIISEDGSGSAPKIDGMRGEQAQPRSEAEADTFIAQPDDAAPESEADPEYDLSAQGFIGADQVIEAEYSRREPARSGGTTRGGQGDEGPLLSAESGSAISGAFGALAQTMLAQNARTLEDVVMEMLQPMLKQWLDDNLPTIVERKVQEEIERVSRGRR